MKRAETVVKEQMKGLIDEHHREIDFQLFNIAREGVKKGYQLAMAEIVCCKDCVHWEGEEDEPYCEEWNICGMAKNFYCASGKRRKE